MKLRKVVLFVIIVTNFLFGQWRLKGTLFTSTYSWEGENGQNLDFYPGLQFAFSNQELHQFQLKGFIRGIYKDEISDFSEKIYNLNMSISLGKQSRLQLGRQFVYDGVVNGTMDGLRYMYKGTDHFRFTVYAGTDSPKDLRFESGNWNGNRFLGLVISGNFLTGQYIQFSTVQKWKHGNKAMHLDGVMISGGWMTKWFYYVDLQYNHLKNEILKNVIRVTYQPNQWKMDLEYVHQLPMIYEFSYFSRFQTVAYDQIRLNIGRTLNQFLLSAGYIYTKLDNDQSSELNVNIARKRNHIGLLYNTGFSGDNFGVYGQIYQPVLSSVYLRLYANYYTYQRYQIDISEEAISYSAGLEYRSAKWMVRTDVQQAINNLYKKDVRFLFHVFYRFAM